MRKREDIQLGLCAIRLFELISALCWQRAAGLWGGEAGEVGERWVPKQFHGLIAHPKRVVSPVTAHSNRPSRARPGHAARSLVVIALSWRAHRQSCSPCALVFGGFSFPLSCGHSLPGLLCSRRHLTRPMHHRTYRRGGACDCDCACVYDGGDDCGADANVLRAQPCRTQRQAVMHWVAAETSTVDRSRATYLWPGPETQRTVVAALRGGLPWWRLGQAVGSLRHHQEPRLAGSTMAPLHQQACLWHPIIAQTVTVLERLADRDGFRLLALAMSFLPFVAFILFFVVGFLRLRQHDVSVMAPLDDNAREGRLLPRAGGRNGWRPFISKKCEWITVITFLCS